jgi:hypothetical protein
VHLRLDGTASTPLDRRGMSTRSPIRTDTVAALNGVPPASWATRAWWTTSVSNRAGAACKAALHTCASPMERTSGLEPDPSAYETDARTCRAALASEPTAGIEPAPTAYKAAARPSCCAGVRTPGRTRTGSVDVLNVVPLPLGYEGMVAGSGGFEPPPIRSNAAIAIDRRRTCSPATPPTPADHWHAAEDLLVTPPR